MPLNPYLTFDGTCRQAFDFYKSVFGGDFIVFQTFGDGPPDMNVADADKDRVMHVSLPVGGAVLMGSDTAQGFGGPIVVGTNFSINIAGESGISATIFCPNSATAAKSRCQCRRRSGVPISVCAATVSTSTG